MTDADCAKDGSDGMLASSLPVLRHLITRLCSLFMGIKELFSLAKLLPAKNFGTTRCSATFHAYFVSMPFVLSFENCIDDHP